MSEVRLGDQQLARALMQKGLITAPQIQMAVARRTADKSFAQVLVELDFVTAIDIVEVDPHAFQTPSAQTLQTAAQTAPASTSNGHSNAEMPQVGLGSRRQPRTR